MKGFSHHLPTCQAFQSFSSLKHFIKYLFSARPLGRHHKPPIASVSCCQPVFYQATAGFSSSRHQPVFSGLNRLVAKSGYLYAKWSDGHTALVKQNAYIQYFLLPRNNYMYGELFAKTLKWGWSQFEVFGLSLLATDLWKSHILSYLLLYKMTVVCLSVSAWQCASGKPVLCG